MFIPYLFVAENNASTNEMFPHKTMYSTAEEFISPTEELLLESVVDIINLIKIFMLWLFQNETEIPFSPPAIYSHLHV